MLRSRSSSGCRICQFYGTSRVHSRTLYSTRLAYPHRLCRATRSISCLDQLGNWPRGSCQPVLADHVTLKVRHPSLALQLINSMLWVVLRQRRLLTPDDLPPIPTWTSSFNRLAVVSRHTASIPYDILPCDKRLTASESPVSLSRNETPIR